ncbi:MAG: hypothetical protein KF901_29565 [Myxococcales bacterium]|nr:hypothetical protein [Myxococcales bacterium]
MSLRRKVALAVAALGVAALYWAPMLYRWAETGHGDWQQFQHQWEAVYVGVVRYGEFPLWNPWHCGGTLLWGDPQAQGFGPIYWLVVAPFGTVAGVKLFLLLHAAVGWVGMYVAARRLVGVGPRGAVAAAILWAGSGFFAWHGSGGHGAFLPFYFTPWVLLAWRKAAQDVRYAAAVAAILALTLWEGGVYPFPFFCVLLAFDGLVQLVRAGDRAERLRVVKAAALTLPLALLLGAWRLVPILTTMSRYPRPTFESDHLSLEEVIAMLTSKEYDYRFPGHEYVWAEYGTFIGWTALLAGLAGLLVAWRRGHRWVVVGVVFFFALLMGRVTAYHPWPLLHHLPVFGSLRVPARFAVFATFYLGLAAGLGVDHAMRALTRAARGMTFAPKLLSSLFLVAMTAHLYWGNAEVIDRWRNAPPPPVDHVAPYHLTPGHEYGAYASFPARGVSTRGCYTGMTFEAARGLWEGEVDQARVPGGRLLSFDRTANTMTLRVAHEGSEPARVIVNQTWAEGWTSDVGVLVRGASGLIEVEGVPPGEHVLRLEFFPSELPIAAALTLLGLLLTALVVVLPRLLARRRGGSFAAELAVIRRARRRARRGAPSGRARRRTRARRRRSAGARARSAAGRARRRRLR